MGTVQTQVTYPSIRRGVIGRSRSVVTIDGSAGAGEADSPSTIRVFTLTGRVRLVGLHCFCTETLVTVNGTVALGVATASTAFIGATAAGAIVTNDWWNNAGNAPDTVEDILEAVSRVGEALSNHIIITIATADITDGTLIFDVWYEPITDNGRLG